MIVSVLLVLDDFMENVCYIGGAYLDRVKYVQMTNVTFHEQSKVIPLNDMVDVKSRNDFEFITI